ncbi:MAG: sigma-54 dependent transcriptional regulator [Nitrospirota bacterium]|jgi:DNA-binding NtrC family response regulator
MLTVLIVEDKPSMARMLEETLETEGYRALTAPDGKTGISVIARESPDIVLTDLKLPGADGIAVLRASKENNPLRPVILMTAFGSVQKAVEAMKEGAFDFITKPFDVDHLLMLVRRALENRRLLTENIVLRDEFRSRFGLPEIVGKSRGILEVAEKVRKVAPTKTTVLVLGESGTGKELFARALHQLSDRKDFPYIPINCAAIPRDLLESELFGYEKGAFTGADSSKTGKFALAHKGTIFLDEIGDMEMALQAKLLRALEEGEIERIGGSGPIKVDVRVIAASNRDLEGAVAEGAFREDLFYRLNVFPLRIPPLRDRKEDIPALVEHFISKCSAEMKFGTGEVSPEALEMLMNYGWKGNVRELKNTIERAIILSEGGAISPEHISLSPARDGFPVDEVPMSGTLAEAAREAQKIAETRRIRKALDEAGGNKTRAAKTLGVSYKTLLTKIKDYGLH